MSKVIFPLLINDLSDVEALPTKNFNLTFNDSNNKWEGAEPQAPSSISQQFVYDSSIIANHATFNPAVPIVLPTRPTASKYFVSHADPTQITNIYISREDYDGFDLTTLIDSWTTGILTLTRYNDPQVQITFKLLSVETHTTGLEPDPVWRCLHLEYVSSSFWGAVTNNTRVFFTFTLQEPPTSNLSELLDVEITNIQDNDIISYSVGDGKYINKQIPPGVQTLPELTDIEILNEPSYESLTPNEWFKEADMTATNWISNLGNDGLDTNYTVVSNLGHNNINISFVEHESEMTSFDLSSDRTFLITLRYLYGGGGTNILQFRNASFSWQILYFNAGQNAWGSNGQALSSSPVDSGTNETFILSMVWNSINQEMTYYVNGVDIGTANIITNNAQITSSPFTKIVYSEIYSDINVGDVLIYNMLLTPSQIIDYSTLLLNHFNNIPALGLENGQVLTYDDTTMKWQNKDNIKTLDILEDTDINTLLNDEVLTYNSISTKWENKVYLSNKNIIETISSAGSGDIISASERSNLHTHSNKVVLDAITAAPLTSDAILSNFTFNHLYQTGTVSSGETGFSGFFVPPSPITYQIEISQLDAPNFNNIGQYFQQIQPNKYRIRQQSVNGLNWHEFTITESPINNSGIWNLRGLSNKNPDFYQFGGGFTLGEKIRTSLHYLKDNQKAEDVSYTDNTGFLPYPTVQQGMDAMITAINGVSGALIWKGSWDASTNTPTLSNATGSDGWYYLCNVGGTVDLGAGSVLYEAGDRLIFNGVLDVYQRFDQYDKVTSVYGRIGVVTAQNGDYIASQITNTPAGNITASTVQGALNELDNNSQLNFLNKTVAPTNTDDFGTINATVGSRWVDVTNDRHYICVDPTNSSAIWRETCEKLEELHDCAVAPTETTYNTTFSATYNPIEWFKGSDIVNVNSWPSNLGSNLNGTYSFGTRIVSNSMGIQNRPCMQETAPRGYYSLGTNANYFNNTPSWTLQFSFDDIVNTGTGYLLGLASVAGAPTTAIYSSKLHFLLMRMTAGYILTSNIITDLQWEAYNQNIFFGGVKIITYTYGLGKMSLYVTNGETFETVRLGYKDITTDQINVDHINIGGAFAVNTNDETTSKCGDVIIYDYEMTEEQVRNSSTDLSLYYNGSQFLPTSIILYDNIANKWANQNIGINKISGTIPYTFPEKLAIDNNTKDLSQVIETERTNNLSLNDLSNVDELGIKYNPAVLREYPSAYLTNPYATFGINKYSWDVTGQAYGNGRYYTECTSWTNVANGSKALFDNSTVTQWIAKSNDNQTLRLIDGSYVLGEWANITFPDKVVVVSVYLETVNLTHSPDLCSFYGSKNGGLTYSLIQQFANADFLTKTFIFTQPTEKINCIALLFPVSSTGVTRIAKMKINCATPQALALADNSIIRYDDTSKLWKPIALNIDNLEDGESTFLSYSVALGYSSKRGTGQENTIYGSHAYGSNGSGNKNTIIGANSGLLLSTGNNNTFAGSRAGVNTNTGNNNIFIGENAGEFNNSCSTSVVIGSNANLGSATGLNNSIVIGNSITGVNLSNSITVPVTLSAIPSANVKKSLYHDSTTGQVSYDAPRVNIGSMSYTGPAIPIYGQFYNIASGNLLKGKWSINTNLEMVLNLGHDNRNFGLLVNHNVGGLGTNQLQYVLPRNIKDTTFTHQITLPNRIADVGIPSTTYVIAIQFIAYSGYAIPDINSFTLGVNSSLTFTEII